MNNASRIYEAYLLNKLVGFIAIIHFPHKTVRNLKKVHRLVVLPDYQGIGIGKALLNWSANYYVKKGFVFGITTSHPAINKSLSLDNNWKMIRMGRMGRIGSNTKKTQLNNTMSSMRETCSWKYVV